MKTLLIADCRSPIKKSVAGCGFARCDHDGGEFVGFLQKWRQLAYGHYPGFNQQFEPQRSFVSLLFHRPDFSDKFRRAAGAATGAIIRRHRSPAANNLFGDDTSRIVIFWNRAGQFDYSQGKSFCSDFQFGWVHSPKLQIQSAIANRKSAIQR